MTQSGSATSTTTLAPASAGRPPGLMVMALRAAEQHVLVVIGEADLHTAGQLRRQLIDALWAEPPSLLVELGALGFCDLAGLDALHDAARAAQDAGVTLTFRGMSPQLTWLHRTFPPRGPGLSPSPPVQARPDPDLSSAAPQPGPGTARTASRPSVQAAATPRTPAPPDPGRPAFTARAQRAAPAADPTDGHRDASPLHGPGGWNEYRAGRGGGRRGAPDGLVHAVPVSDATRSAVCGARVWPAKAPPACPGSTATVRVPSLAVTTSRRPSPVTSPRATPVGLPAQG